MSPARRRAWPAWLIAFALLLSAGSSAVAHERFVKHNLKVPLHIEYFGRWPPPAAIFSQLPADIQRDMPNGIFGMNPDMFKVTMTTTLVLFAFMFVWFSRHLVMDMVHEKVLTKIGGPFQKYALQLGCFLTDRPVRSKTFKRVGEWGMIMFMRCPALVLMFSATNDSLVMPSYPLDPPTVAFFQMAQVFLAILILTGTMLPLAGALVWGTWFFLFKWGWMVATDAMPVLTVAVLYVTSPWNSHKLAITEVNAVQLRWVRIILGLGFFVLGFLKMWNHNLVAGVGDNNPGLLKDPMIGFFTIGTHHYFNRENFIWAFGASEVASGFMVMAGVFTRVWGTLMIIVFTKLMVVDFGYAEIPHIYPIGALLCVLFANHHKADFGIAKLEERVDHWRRQGKPFKQLIAIGVPAFIIAFLVMVPMVWGMTFFEYLRTNL